jgi:hypothetical protein
MIHTKCIGISLRKDLLNEIDQLRGLVPRSLYISKMLEWNLNQKVVEGIGFQPSPSTILTTDSTNAIDSPATEEDSLSSEPKEVSNINGR